MSIFRSSTVNQQKAEENNIFNKNNRTAAINCQQVRFWDAGKKDTAQDILN